MKPPIYTATATFIDKEGKYASCRGRFLLAPDTGPPLQVRDIDALVLQWAGAVAQASHAHLHKVVWESRQVVTLTLPAAVPGALDSAEDKAYTQWLDAAGGTYVLAIPAPISAGGLAVFLHDNETVNPQSAPMHLIRDVLTADNSVRWVTVKGGNIKTYELGFRQRKHNQRHPRPGIATETGGE